MRMTIISSSQKKMKYSVQHFNYKVTIIYEIDDPRAKYISLEKKIAILRHFGLSPSSGMVVRNGKYLDFKAGNWS